jgi:hypothetical protein
MGPCLQSHIYEGRVDQSFFHERTINAVCMIGMIYMIAMIGVDQLCARRKPIGARIGPIGPMSGRDRA